MLLVFPVSIVDAHLALPLAEWMRDLGPYRRHRALIAWSSELPLEKREPIAAAFRAMDWSHPPLAFTVRIPDAQQKWPDAANLIFRECVEVVEAQQDLRMPWFFFEPDCTPLARGWLDVLADAYNADLSKPFLGTFDKTFLRRPDGSLHQYGQHLVGTAIYPQNLSAYTSRHKHRSFAFDIAMADDVMPRARDTTLIQHNWSTGNYRRENGEIVCDMVTLRATQVGQPQPRPVRDDVVVLHGCKDGSLARLLREPEVVPEQASLEPPVVLEPVLPEPAPLEEAIEAARSIPSSGRLKIPSPQQAEKIQEIHAGLVGNPTLEANPIIAPRRKRGRPAKVKPGWLATQRK